jgi:beta-glucanase (GH16 family)
MLKHRLTYVILLVLISHVVMQAQNQFTYWAEEFNYSGLPDPAKWNMETGGGGWGNNESQYYTDNLANAQVANGVLTITAKEQTIGSNPYTSARITTKDKFEFKYGKIEARIKLPYGQGIWPAFWMLGENIYSAGWPACGEIDIMEMVGGAGNDNVCHSTIHWDHNGTHAYYGQSYTLPSGIFANAYHIFTAEWNNQEIRTYMDGIHYYTADITPSELNEFHNEFFIIMNLAVGGNWPGYPNASTVFPQTMKVDYIRVYKDDFPQPIIDGPSMVAQGDTVSYSTLYIPELSYDWDLPSDAIIFSGSDSSVVTAIWGATTDYITVEASGGTIAKTSDPYLVTAACTSEVSLSHVNSQNQLMWQVQPTASNTISLSGTNELEVNYDIAVPPNNAHIFYELPSIQNFWAIPKMKLRLKTETGNPPANLRIDLYDVNGVNGQSNHFSIDPINSDGNYHTYYHNFSEAPSGNFRIDKVAEIRIYINFGNFVMPNSGKFWILPIEMVTPDVSSMNEFLNLSDIQIFPNPFFDDLFIHMPKFNGPVQVNIFNLNGNKIQSYNSVKNIEKMKLAHIPSGIYIIEVNYKDQYFKHKILKNS